MKKFKKLESRAHNKNQSKAHPRVPRGSAPVGLSRRSSPPASAGPKGRCVVGIHAVNELLRVRPHAITQLWLREGYQDRADLKEIFESAQRQKVRPSTHAVGALDKITSHHQGVLAFSSEEPELDWASLAKLETSTLVALDEVEDPHNLGAVLRTAWLMGAQAVFTPEHRAAALSPAVSKVAQGAVEHVPVLRDSALPQQLEELKRQGYWILGLAHTAKQQIYSFEIPQKVVWVFGSEASGLRKSVLGVCDDLIGIPQLVPAASYNVSVAAAIVLGETFRQRTQAVSRS